MKSLSGNLKDMGILDVLELLRKSHATGNLEIRGKGISSSIISNNGKIVDISFEKVHGIDVLKNIALFEKGFFVFTSEKVRAEKTINISTEEILMTLLGLQNEWAKISEKIKSIDSIPALKRDTSTNEISLNREEITIIGLIDGKRSIRDISEQLNFSYFDVGKIISKLIDKSLVKITGEKERFKIKPVKLTVGFMSNPLKGENGTWMSRILAMAPRSLLDEFENESVVWIDVKLVSKWESELTGTRINSVLITTPNFKDLVLQISPQLSLYDNIIFHNEMAEKFELKEGDIVEVLPNA